METPESIERMLEKRLVPSAFSVEGSAARLRTTLAGTKLIDFVAIVSIVRFQRALQSVGTFLEIEVKRQQPRRALSQSAEIEVQAYARP